MIKVNVKRDRLAIVAEVLEMAGTGVQKNRLLSAGGMSSDMLNRYLSLMTNAALLEEVSLGNKVGFRTSPKGAEFLHFYYEITSLIRTDNDNRIVACKRIQLPTSLSS